MNKKLMINTSLVRKESEFRTKSCVLEKAIAVPHAEFENLKSHPLRDNDLIAENADMMYCDSGDIYHRLLVYDEEQGDGLMIESEGTAYARYVLHYGYRQAWRSSSRQDKTPHAHRSMAITGLYR